MTLMFPQAGIVTSLDVAGARAKVFLPLYKIETAWIPVATSLLYQTQITIDTPVLAADPPGSIIRPPEEPAIEFTDILATSGAADKISWGTLKVGDEVVVVFLNGNLNDGRVIARI